MSIKTGKNIDVAQLSSELGGVDLTVRPTREPGIIEIEGDVSDDALTIKINTHVPKSPPVANSVRIQALEAEIERIKNHVAAIVTSDVEVQKIRDAIVDA